MAEDFDEEKIEEPGEFLDLEERAIALEEVDSSRTLSESEEETEHKTDLQAAMRALLPRFKNKRMNDLLQPAMVSRIFPDNYLDKNFLIVMSVIEEQEGADDIDIVGIISTVQDATSIGYEGRGRVDILEVAGVAHEEELEKLSKDLGL